MPRFTLRLNAAEETSPEVAASSFYWLNDQRSTFTPALGPGLEVLGPVTDLNIDVVHIAVTAFAADRSVPREGRGSNWNRSARGSGCGRANRRRSRRGGG